MLTHNYGSLWNKTYIPYIHARIQEFTSGGYRSDNVFFFFFFFFLVLSLFYWSQIVNFKENHHFSRFQRGSNIFQGGPTFSRGGGVQSLIPYRNPYSLWFSRGGGVQTSVPPPSGSALDICPGKCVNMKKHRLTELSAGVSIWKGDG